MNIVLSHYEIDMSDRVPVVRENPQGSTLTPRIIGDQVRLALRQIDAGQTYGTKAVLQPPRARATDAVAGTAGCPLRR